MVLAIFFPNKEIMIWYESTHKLLSESWIPAGIAISEWVGRILKQLHHIKKDLIYSFSSIFLLQFWKNVTTKIKKKRKNISMQ